MENNISAREYDRLQKVTEVGICLDVPQKVERTISRNRMREESLHDNPDTDSRYGLVELVMVYKGRKEPSGKGTQFH